MTPTATSTGSAEPASDPDTADPLNERFARSYEWFARIAASVLRSSGSPGHLDAAVLVNEAFIRLQRFRSAGLLDDGAFRAAVVRTMERVLIDHQRHDRRAKRGGGRKPQSLDQHSPADDGDSAESVVDLLDLLSRLERPGGRRAQIVELRIFGRYTFREIAKLLDCPLQQVRADWASARQWLLSHLSDEC